MGTNLTISIKEVVNEVLRRGAIRSTMSRNMAKERQPGLLTEDRRKELEPMALTALIHSVLKLDRAHADFDEDPDYPTTAVTVTYESGEHIPPRGMRKALVGIAALDVLSGVYAGYDQESSGWFMARADQLLEKLNERMRRGSGELAQIKGWYC